MTTRQDRPLAAPGLVSYRYPNPYGGFIMIGARDDADALKEAKRSLTSGSPPTPDLLEVWDQTANRYVPAGGPR